MSRIVCAACLGSASCGNPSRARGTTRLRGLASQRPPAPPPKRPSTSHIKCSSAQLWIKSRSASRPANAKPSPWTTRRKS
eukprot:7034009-Alexandrium_andersonii.AAC.1